MFAAHQLKPDQDLQKIINVAIFDHVDAAKYFCEVNGFRYPKDANDLESEKNNYPIHKKNLNFFGKKCVDEKKMKPFICYPDIKNFYPIHLTDL